MNLDKDLKTILDSFQGYGVEPWMRTELLSMAQKVQALRDAIRAHRKAKGESNEDENDLELYAFLKTSRKDKGK